MPATPAEMVSALRGAGFPASAIPVGVAIGYAESSGIVDNISPVNSDGSQDFGTWQINNKAHAALLASGNWRDINVNARMAYTVWKDAGNSWSPWSSFTSGRFRKYTGMAQNVDSSTPNPLAPTDLRPPDGIPGLPSITVPGLEGVQTALSKITNPDFWKRAGWVVLGVGMLIAGLLIIFAKPLETATGTVAKAALA